MDGDSTVTDSTTSSSSLSEYGSTNATDSYVLSKTASGYHDATSTGNSVDGGYTLSGSESSTSTAIETQTYGTYGATFTEILGSSDTFEEYQDDNAAEYTLSDSGTNSDNFSDDGTDAAGTFMVTEGSAGTFDNNTQGETDIGDYTVTSTTGDTYSYTEEVTGGSYPYTQTEHGTESASSMSDVDTVTGTYTTTASGTDVYTLWETGTVSGGTFAETVNGTDGYSYSDTGNTGQETDTSTTTGGGSWSRTVSGAGAGVLSPYGSNSYTVTDSGNALLGSFSEGETGTDRYGLVYSFDDVANDGSGSTPGNVTFHGNGLPFRDPEQTVRCKWGEFTVNSIPYNQLKNGDRPNVSGVEVWITFKPDPKATVPGDPNTQLKSTRLDYIQIVSTYDANGKLYKYTGNKKVEGFEKTKDFNEVTVEGNRIDYLDPDRAAALAAQGMPVSPYYNDNVRNPAGTVALGGTGALYPGNLQGQVNIPGQTDQNARMRDAPGGDPALFRKYELTTVVVDRDTGKPICALDWEVTTQNNDVGKLVIKSAGSVPGYYDKVLKAFNKKYNKGVDVTIPNKEKNK